jgi:hypothetical protein
MLSQMLINIGNLLAMHSVVVALQVKVELQTQRDVVKEQIVLGMLTEHSKLFEQEALYARATSPGIRG